MYDSISIDSANVRRDSMTVVVLNGYYFVNGRELDSEANIELSSRNEQYCIHGWYFSQNSIFIESPLLS